MSDSGTRDSLGQPGLNRNRENGNTPAGTGTEAESLPDTPGAEVRPLDPEQAEAIIEDLEDLADARVAAGVEPSEVPPLWKRLGPGLITGIADDDPSGIGTYSVAGAQFGHGLLWMSLYSYPLMVAVQEMCGRVAAVTGKGLTTILKEHYPRWLMWGAVTLLLGANILNIWADLNVMGASLQMLFGGSFFVWLSVVTAFIIGGMILTPYRIYVKLLKWLCLALLAYIVTAFLPKLHLNWGEIGKSLIVPRWSKDPQFMFTVVGFLGTTISPYLFFWQAAETVEEEVAEGEAVEPGRRVTRVKEGDIQLVRTDTMIGMAASQAVCFFIMVTTAATLFAHHIKDINTAQDAAKALAPLGGQAAYWLFASGIVGAGLLAVPTLAGSAAYSVSEAFGWRYGLYRRFRRARGFYGAIALFVLIGYLLNFVHTISPIKALVYSAVLNGIAAPPLIVMLLFICNNPRIVRGRKNGRWSNLLGWLAAILMGIAVVMMIWGMATGQNG